MYNPQEAKLDFLITRSILAFGLILLMGLVGSLAAKEGMIYGLISIFPIKTIAYVDELDFSKTTNYPTVHYSFKINKKTFKGSFEASSKNHEGKYIYVINEDKTIYKVGDSLEVLYSSLINTYHYPEKRLKYLEYSFYIFAFTAFISILGILFIVWNFFKIIKYYDKSKYY